MTHQRWNAMNSEQRYAFLFTCYGRPEPTERGAALVNVLSKFSLSRWSRLPVLMRQGVLRHVPHPKEAR